MTLTARDISLREALDRLADSLDARWDLPSRPWALLEGRAPPERAYTPGARIDWRARAYGDGLVLETRVQAEIMGRIEVDLDVPGATSVERCGACSPYLVYVRGVTAVAPALTVTRTWFSPYELEFRDPKAGDRRRVGDVAIEVAWPKMKVTAAKAARKDLLTRICGSFDFELRPGVERRETEIVARGRGTYDRRTGEKTWCNCPGGPTPWAPVRPELVHEWDVRNLEASSYALAEVARVALTFSKPVAETVRIAGPEVRAK